MPGPVSDSFDSEWETTANGNEISKALNGVYNRLSVILGHSDPKYILDLVRDDLPQQISATLSEKEWRILRFAIARANESI